VLRELCRPPLAWIGLAGAAAIVGVWLWGGDAWIGLLTALVGMIGAGAMVWAVRIGGSMALRREAMGFGDVTFMMMVGTFVGWQAGIFIFFVAPLAGVIVGLMQLVLRYDDVIPYVPYLALATLAVVVRWADFWNADEAGMQGFFAVPWLVPVVLAICVIMLWAVLVLWRNLKEAIFKQA
jgi:prepilin signal peptidase PulO-like enzyme (type II secretory pathway)